jgi:hypothetical protein
MTTETQVRIILAKVKKQDGIIAPSETRMLAEWVEIQLAKAAAAKEREERGVGRYC